jgi:hypothetical protein
MTHAPKGDWHRRTVEGRGTLEMRVTGLRAVIVQDNRLHRLKRTDSTNL